MGLSEDLDEDGITPQVSYYASLNKCRRRDPQRAAMMAAWGPPPPAKADGVDGQILWHEYHLPTVDELAALVKQMRDEEYLTAGEAAEFIGEPTAEHVARLKAAVIATHRLRGHQ